MQNKALMTIAAMLVVGCASAPKVEKIPNSADPNEEISKLNTDMQDATATQADILAPHAWSEASDYKKRAQDRLADNDSKEKVLDAVAEARAYLKEAVSTADQVPKFAPDLVEVRHQAMEVRAPEYAKKEFGKAETYLRDFASDREGTTEGISDGQRAEIRDLYIQARVSALQNQYLGKSRELINDAQKNDADRLVPNLVGLAQRSLKNAEAYIASNRLDIAGIQEQTQKATNDAQRLERLNNEARHLKNASPEQQALLLDKTMQQNRALNGKLDKTMDEAAFQERFEQAQQMFTRDEAEVYKQGDSLLIRLKSIDFPSGKATLPSSSFALVTKVGNAVKTFGDPKIRIEGNTDSTGGHEVNMRLSQDRAEAVKDYLVANSGLKAEQLEVVGLGDTRPLASNKTATGRAQNRRVDITVTPVITQEAPQIRQAQ